MPSLHRLALAAAAAALTCAAGILFGLAGSNLEATLGFSGLAVAAIFVSAFAIPRSGSNAAATMPPSFVFTFVALLQFGGEAATVVAAASAATAGLVEWQLARPRHGVTANVATV